MVALAQFKQINEVETRFTVSGEAEARRAMDGVAGAQDKMAAGAKALAVVTETVEKKQLDQSKAANSLRASFDDAYKAQQRYQTDLAKISRFEARGDYGADLASDLRNKAAAKYKVNDNDPSRVGLSSYDKSFIKYQGFDVASSLGSGAGLGTVAFQQGPQILQQLADREGGLTAGLKQLGTSALGLITPFTLAAAATAGAVAAFGLAAKQASDDQAMLKQATLGVGRGTGASVSQLDSIAQRNAEPGKLSVGSAREATAAFAATGQIALPVFDTLISKASDYARLTEQELPAATAELARAFSDVGRGADDIAGKIGGLDDRTRQLMQTQLEQGDKTAAQTTLAQYLKAQVDANTQATTGWAAAWLTVSSAADKAWESLKRTAGVSLGVVTETPQQAIDRLQAQLKDRSRAMNDPMGYGAEDIRAQLEAARRKLSEEAAAAAREADVAKAKSLSLEGNAIARNIDPNGARLSDLTKNQSTLRDTLSNPTYWEKMSTEDFQRLRGGYDAVTEAKNSLSDANGRLISSEERTRQQNQLALEMAKATTDADKAEIAAKQKRLELAGQTLTRSDRESQIDYARRLSLASASAKSGGDSDSRDEYDRALRSVEDRTRRQAEEAATYGMGAEAVARYRTETELLTAAMRAERDITPELSAQIQGYADKAAAAADQQSKLRESMRDMDEFRGTGRSVLSSFTSDLNRGTSLLDSLGSGMDRIKTKVLDLASTSIIDGLFGKTGTSATGLLGSLFSGSGGMGSSIASFLGFADGGLLTGPGGPRSDNLLIAASPGEYVINAAATQHHRPLLDYINGGGRATGYANGGAIPAPGGEFGDVAGFGEVLA